MPWRFYRRKRICHGLAINFSKSGVSLTLGSGPLHYTLRQDGRRRVTVGVPGTGLYYTRLYQPRRKK